MSDRVQELLASFNNTQSSLGGDLDFVSSFLKKSALPVPANLFGETLYVVSQLCSRLMLANKKIVVLEQELEQSLNLSEKKNLKM